MERDKKVGLLTMGPKELSCMEMVQILTEKPMSQKEVAEELGLSEQYVK